VLSIKLHNSSLLIHSFSLSYFLFLFCSLFTVMPNLNYKIYYKFLVGEWRQRNLANLGCTNIIYMIINQSQKIL
jgi:hypothetical protein